MNANLRMPLDISMTILSILLMGGATLFPSDIVHEILGAALFALWAVHITLNRKWYRAIFKGKYNPRRAIQTFVNCAILICAAFLMVSGIILSNRIFAFLGIESGLGFARVAHLLASHWYFLFMSVHIALHSQMIAAKMKIRGKAAALKIVFAAISIYGAYAFAVRGVWKYLFLQQEFFFIDLEKGFLLFLADYISILFFFAALTRLILRRL